MQSPPFSRYLVPPRSKYSPQHHILKQPSFLSSLNVSDRVSHPYKATDKITVRKTFQRLKNTDIILCSESIAPYQRVILHVQIYYDNQESLIFKEKKIILKLGSY